MFKILGANNRRKNLHKHHGPSFQIRGGPGSFSMNLQLGIFLKSRVYCTMSEQLSKWSTKNWLFWFFFEEVHSLHLLFCWLKSFIQNLFVKTVDALDEPESVDYYTQTSFYQEQTSKCREYLRWSTFVQVAGWWITWFISSWEENNFCQSWAYQTIANYFQLTQSNSNWLRLPYFLI